MPTISPELSFTSKGVPKVVWEELATGDTVVSYPVNAQHGLAVAVQISGTFGGATVVLQCSNDGDTWFTTKDTQGTDVSATADAFFEVSTAAAYLRFAISGGTSDDVDCTLVFRG